MRTNFLLLLAFCVICSTSKAQDVGVEAAQTAEGATLRGAGAYLKGMGWYNLNTAQAASINADTAIKWQRDLRKLAQDDRNLRARIAAGKTARIADIQRRLREREQQLRTNPIGNDVASGEALNVLLFDLTDPDFTTDKWLKNPVPLPNGMSVKDLTFQFMSASNSADSSKLLSRGVIALSRLDIEGKWTTALSVKDLESERKAYEKAYAKVRDEVLDGKLTVDALLAMDRTLDSLKSKVQTAVPVERGFRTEAARFVEELKTATRMFDASTVEYAKEMLLDTQEHDAKTVLELVRFMLKYRLQFAPTQRSPSGRELYGELYELMKVQLTGLGGGSVPAQNAGNESPDKGEPAPIGTWVESRPGTPVGDRIRTFKKDGTLVVAIPKMKERVIGTWRRDGSRVYFSHPASNPKEPPTVDKWFVIAKSNDKQMTIHMMGDREYVWLNRPLIDPSGLITGVFDVAWKATDTGTEGVSKYTFLGNNVVMKETRVIGGWRIVGKEIEITFVESKRGKAWLQFHSSDAFDGIHKWDDGKAATWAATRSQ